MKRGTTPLLPPSPTTGVGLEPQYHDIIDIIEDIWQAIAEVERRMAIKYTKNLETKVNYSKSLETKLYYYYNLSEWWEDVYLVLAGKEIYDKFF